MAKSWPWGSKIQVKEIHQQLFLSPKHRTRREGEIERQLKSFLRYKQTQKSDI